MTFISIHNIVKYNYDSSSVVCCICWNSGEEKMKKNLINIEYGKWQSIFRDLGLKNFTHKQVYTWIFKKCVRSFQEMSNLSQHERDILEKTFSMCLPKVERILEADDGTKKFLLLLEDGQKIESVLIPVQDRRITLCISSQVGCNLGCQFCRTASLGLIRNLTIAEIVGQILLVKEYLRTNNGQNKEITNIVFMGMGEPLNNYDNVKNSIEIMGDKIGLCIAKRRITLSTAGIVPNIKMMKTDDLGVKLAVSLNATTDEQRKEIMPIAVKYTINEIIDACKDYTKSHSRWRTTFEYVLIGNFNDSLDDAKRLVKLMNKLPSKLNLIPFNSFPESNLMQTSDSALDLFYDYIYQKHIQVNIRKSRGQEILAACGQLAADK